jgi:hypothetical protein
MFNYYIINAFKGWKKPRKNLFLICFPEEQSEKISLQIEAHQKEGETFSTAQFNQLGDAADSHFYAYFMTMVVICIIGYLVFHNKQKVCNLEKLSGYVVYIGVQDDYHVR